MACTLVIEMGINSAPFSAIITGGGGRQKREVTAYCRQLGGRLRALLPAISHLPERLSAGLGTLALQMASLPTDTGLPRFRWAGPSTSLDKSIQLEWLWANSGLGVSQKQPASQ